MTIKIHQIGKKLALLLVWLCLTACTYAQQHRLVFEEIGVKEGLPEEFVTGIIQDENGYMWMSTQNGLVKYDGYQLKVIRGEIDSFAIKNATAFLEARNKSIWFGQSNVFQGLIQYKPEINQFIFIEDTIQKEETGSLFSYFPIMEDYFGNIWLLREDPSTTTAKGKLMRLNPNSGHFKIWDEGFESFLTSGSFTNHSGHFGLSTSKKDSSVWYLDFKHAFREDMKASGDLMHWNANTDSFEIVFSPGQIIPGTNFRDTVNMLTQLPEGNILFKSESKIFIWDPVLRKVINTFSPENSNLLPDKIAPEIPCFVDEYGQIWVLHHGGHISVIYPQKDSVATYRWGGKGLDFDHNPDNILLLELIAQNEQDIWFTIRYDGPHIFLRFSHKSQKFTIYDNQLNDPQNPTLGGWAGRILPFQSLLDHSGLLWIGTRPSLYRQSPKSRQFDYFSNSFSSKNFLPSDTIVHLYCDQKNNLWIATRSGLGRYDITKEKFITYRCQANNPTTIPHDWAWNFSEDSYNNLWISFANGFAKWDPEDDTFTRFFYDSKYSNSFDNGFGPLFEIEKGKYIIPAPFKGIFEFNSFSGEVKGLYLLEDSEINGLSSREVWRFMIDSYGDWWVGNRQINQPALFRRKKGTDTFISYQHNYLDSTSIGSNEFRFIFEDQNTGIWIGTDNGLYEFNRKTETFKRIGKDEIASVISFVKSAGKEKYIFSYSGNGLIKLNTETQSYKFFSEKQGLLHNDVVFNYTAPGFIDSLGLIWLPTRRGLSVFDTKSETFTNYLPRDGFRIEDQFHVTVDTFGHIWIGGNKGLHRIDPVALMQKDSTLPNLVLTGLQINDQRYENPDSNILTRHISYTDAITLSHDQKNLTFEFVALHYLRPEDNQYSWKLENYDDHWSEPSLERKANYTNLSPGTYTFRVRGSNADGIWNEEGTSLQITILSPWWATGWAYFFYAILIALAVWSIVQWRTRFLRKQRETLQTKVAEQTMELRQRNEDLRQAKEEALAAEASAREANETKSNFLSTVSHELRTPLTSVLGFAKIIRKRFSERVKPALPTDDKKLNRTVDQIEKNLDVVVLEGERLTNLINDVLDLAKIESGRTEWHLEPIDLNVLVHQAYLSTSSLFEGKGLTYHEDLAPNLPAVTGDHDKLVQVMINLLSNAVKFTDEGSVTITTGLEGDHVVVRVTDTGIGIARADMPKVFEKFRQVGDTLTDKPKGTGLGLPICKEIIEHLDGRIWVDSSVGVGSTFAFALPLKTNGHTPKGISRIDELLEELKKKMPIASVIMPKRSGQNILVVDDEPSIRELLRQELSDTGYQVTLAEDGKQALQKVREQRPDMIILDVMMPELSGFDLAAILKNDPRTLNIPILILSIVQDKDRGFQIGVDRYLHKPIDTDLLLREVEALLIQRSSSKKVIVVDENQTTAGTLVQTLKAKGFQVVETGGKDLLDLAPETMPDVIILNAALNEREQIIRTLRFEKGLESVLFVMYQ